MNTRQLKNGADPNASYFMGFEINFVGVSKVEALKLLLRYGANPNKRDRSGLTPLMKAARHPQGLSAVKLLVEYGADVNDITGERHDYRTVLHHSIFSGRLDIIKHLLTNGARYPHLQFDKPSPLDIAIISGRQDIVRLLIDYDADVNAGSESTIGQPLQTALTQKIDNKYKIVELLLDNGANPNSPRTSNRKTGPPLNDYLKFTSQCATANLFHPPEGRESSSGFNYGPDPDMIRLLLKYGARVILKPPSEAQSGLLRDLMRMHDDISLESLYLLVDAAEQIDLVTVKRLIHRVLCRNTGQTSEPFDPSAIIMTTPELLTRLLTSDDCYQNYYCRALVDYITNRSHSSGILSLQKQSRIIMRRHLMEDRQLSGRNLIRIIRNICVPSIMRRYLLYEDQ